MAQLTDKFSTHRIGRLSPDASHDRDDDVFFNREWTRVDINAEDPEIRKVACPGFAKRKGQ